MTLAEELELAARLLALRRELLAIALLDPAGAIELERLCAEVAAGALRVEAVVDELEAPEAARERLEAFRAQLSGGGRREPRRSPGAGATGTPSHDRPTLPPELEGPMRCNLDAIQALRLSWDSVERILDASWVGSFCEAARSRARCSLPEPLRERVRWLRSQIDELVERFVTSNQGLVFNVAHRYRGLGLSREDLMQDGNIGLLRAIEKFDERRSTPFAPYAAWWVRESMRRALAFEGRTIRLPMSALARHKLLGRASTRLSQELGRDPSQQELAQATGVPPESIADVMRAAKEPLSLDAPRSSGSELTLGDALPDSRAPNPNEHASARERAHQLQSLLDSLTARERFVLELRFGLDGGGERTLEKIGESLSLTRERVRQIVAAALVKLNEATRQRQLEL